jgi:hypothetical protein
LFKKSKNQNLFFFLTHWLLTKRFEIAMSKPESTDDAAGAILPDGRVNIDFLQREIASDLSNDARYSAEDGMKKRAVHLSKYLLL